MSEENIETTKGEEEEQPQTVEVNGKMIMKYLQSNRNGATLGDVVRHLKNEFHCSETEQLSKSVEKVMESGVAIGFLHKDGVQYYAWNPIENVRHRRAKPAKRRRRTEEPDRHSNPSDEDLDSIDSHRSSEGKPAPKRRSDNNGEPSRRRGTGKKEPSQQHRSDDEGDPPPRRHRRRRGRPGAVPAECYCYTWTPRRRPHRSFSSMSSASSSALVS